MFEITHAEMRNKNFINGVQKVYDHPCPDFKTSYNIKRIVDLLDIASKDASDVYKKLARAHGTIEADGSFKLSDGQEESWKKSQEDFLGHKIKVERHKLRIGDIDGVPLSPSEVSAMEPLLDGLDALDN